MKHRGLKFVQRIGYSDKYEENQASDPASRYKKLIHNTMARLYTYSSIQLFIKGKVETFNMVIDLKGLVYSECKEVSYTSKFLSLT